MWKTILATVGIVTLLLGAEVGGQYAIAEFVTQKAARKKISLMVLGVVLYLLIPFLFLWLLRTQQKLTVANTMWQAMNIFIVALLGYFVFKESLSPFQIVGIGLALVATVLMFFEPKSKDTTTRRGM